MTISDILVHIRQQLDAVQRQHVEESLRSVEGVISPRFVANRDRFLLVAYNPDRINSVGLIETFRGLGLDARLVGM